MPYAQPPVGNLRFQLPQSLTTTWNETRNATQYSPECYGYGSDDWVLGNVLAEDCLTINVVRPSGVEAGANLPVLFWIHGGGFFEGGSRDPRYNQSFLVQQSVYARAPIVAVSINYRLSGWGFLYGNEVAEAGVANIGLRDQRLALQWVQENIEAFGGDPTKVVIQGESAGGNSVGSHLIAYGGRDDGLFRGAIAESGAPTALSIYYNASGWQPFYDTVVNATNCTTANDTLQCLRTVPAEILSDVFNSTALEDASWRPVIDGDFLVDSGATLLRKGRFVKVPFLLGTNFDEGTAFGTQGINTTKQFIEDVISSGTNISNATAATIAALYPDIPEIGIPATLKGRPAADTAYGSQFKRAAAYGGDLYMHAGRRLTNQMWAKYQVSSYSYHFNVLVNGVPAEIGATHFQEVIFVFHNLNGEGYNNSVSVNPFANEPPTFTQLATLMSRMWISFVNDLDPNNSGVSCVHWPVYTLDDPKNIVFDVNVTNLAYAEADTFRAEGIQFIADNFETYFGR